ncbi:MAG TPA: hypothetical protein PKA06_11940 [Gemmatales bacterium]|nr:hypothetical protein [Gemmatales bacterium]
MDLECLKLLNISDVLLSYLEAGDSKINPISLIPHFFSALDPSPSGVGMSSYPINAQIVAGSMRLNTSSFSDGLSNTIGVSEHYSLIMKADGSRYVYNWFREYPANIPNPNLTLHYHLHRPTFADNGPKVWLLEDPPYHFNPLLIDVYPITSNGITKASIPGKTFQIRPSPSEADPHIPQSPHAAFIVGMLDGRVSSLGRYTSEGVFWSLVTPSGCDNFSDDNWQ